MSYNITFSYQSEGVFACSRGCFFCRVPGDNARHSSGCCAKTICNSVLWERQVQSWLKAEQKHKAENTALDCLRESVIAVQLAMQVMKGQAEGALDGLRRLAQQVEEDELAERARAMIAARVARLRERQAGEEEPEQPREQKPKVVHVPAKASRPGELATQTKKAVPK